MDSLKTYTLFELAEKYNVSLRTLHYWLAPIKQQLLDVYPKSKKRLRILLPKQIKIIEEYLG